MDNTSEIKPYIRKRKIDQLSSDVSEIVTPVLAPLECDENDLKPTATALSVREKLKSSLQAASVFFFN